MANNINGNVMDNSSSSSGHNNPTVNDDVYIGDSESDDSEIQLNADTDQVIATNMYNRIENDALIHSTSWNHPTQSDTNSLATLVTPKKISDSRRTFCLLVLFDLLLTSILWLISCGTSSSSDHSFIQVLALQVTKYNVSYSLFDIVILAAVRFLFLELTYAIIRIRNPWAVAVSTALSDILLILKIFPIFQQSTGKHSDLPGVDVPMAVVLVLSNFVLTWIEVWLMDFKVLPFETRLARRTVQAFMQNSHLHGSVGALNTSANEKTPLIAPSFRAYSTSHYTAATSDQASFYSPKGTPVPSEVGFVVPGRPQTEYISPEDVEQVERGKGALNQLWSLYRNKTCWKTEKQVENGSMVYSTDLLGYGKTFRIDAIIDGISARTVYQEIIVKSENMPQWNTTVDEIKILKRIGEQTAISLEVSAPAAGGLIKSREFLTVRRVDKIGEIYISAGIFTDYDAGMNTTDKIRGENGPTGFIIEPFGSYSCKFTWILNTNLKGSIPQYLVNSNLIATLVKFVCAMKEYLDGKL